MTKEPNMKEPIKIELTAQQALVLFDWVKRFNERESGQFEDQAEERVLWDVEATLEKALVEPFQDDYERLLAEARAAVRDPEE